MFGLIQQTFGLYDGFCMQPCMQSKSPRPASGVTLPARVAIWRNATEDPRLPLFYTFEFSSDTMPKIALKAH